MARTFVPHAERLYEAENRRVSTERALGGLAMQQAQQRLQGMAGNPALQRMAAEQMGGRIAQRYPAATSGGTLPAAQAPDPGYVQASQAQPVINVYAGQPANNYGAQQQAAGLSGASGASPVFTTAQGGTSYGPALGGGSSSGGFGSSGASAPGAIPQSPSLATLGQAGGQQIGPTPQPPALAQLGNQATATNAPQASQAQLAANAAVSPGTAPVGSGTPGSLAGLGNEAGGLGGGFGGAAAIPQSQQQSMNAAQMEGFAVGQSSASNTTPTQTGAIGVDPSQYGPPASPTVQQQRQSMYAAQMAGFGKVA